MEFHFVMVLFVASVAVSITSAIVPQEMYWQSVLPTTPMPHVLHDLLPSDQKSKKSIHVGDGSDKNDAAMSGILNGGILHYESNKNDPAISGILNGGILHYESNKNDPEISRILNGGILHYESNKNDPEISRILNGGILHYESNKNDPEISENLNGGSFKYESNKNELIISSLMNMTLFFLGKDLQPGKDMKLYLARSSTKSKFLPRQDAEMIPLSSETVNKFVRPNSPLSKLWKNTVKICKKSNFEEGKDEYCATSLEEMVDFVASKLGKNIHAFSTDIDKDLKQYIINQDVRMLGTKMVMCQRQVYAYPVFFCHEDKKKQKLMKFR